MEAERALAEAQQHAQSAVEARRAAADQQDRDCRALEALRDQHTEALADAEERRAKAVAEQDRLLRLVDQHASDFRRLEADLATVRAGIERHLTQEHERAMASRDREHGEIIARLKAELELAIDVQKRLEMSVERDESEQQRLAAAHAAERSDAERWLGKATIEKNHAVKALTDQRVEVQHWREAAWAMEPLATLGRLATHLSPELHELVTSLDERAQLLLAVSRLDTSHRPLVEALRADAIRAASLVRQLSRSHEETSPAHETL
jgi:hypothetical protein